MQHFGPTRRELIFRLVFSLVGLVAVVIAVLYRGITHIAAFEIIGFGGLFFGGSAIWSAWKLYKSR